MEIYQFHYQIAIIQGRPPDIPQIEGWMGVRRDLVGVTNVETAGFPRCLVYAYQYTWRHVNKCYNMGFVCTFTQPVQEITIA